MSTNLVISFCAGEYVWVIVDPDKATRSIQKGLIRLITTQTQGSTPEITYHIRLPGDAGTTQFTDSEPPEYIFAIADKAAVLAKYGDLL